VINIGGILKQILHAWKYEQNCFEPVQSKASERHEKGWEYWEGTVCSVPV